MHTLLVIGSTGLLGDALVREALAQGWRVRALVRNLKRRRAELEQRWPGADLVQGDVSEPGLGLSETDRTRLADTTFTLDAFGVFAFGLSRERAQLNVRGALHALRFASTLPKLRAHGHVGGYRVAIDEQGRHGAYEASKRAAVREVRQCAEQLGVPLTQLHPSTVIGDSQTGATSQLIGFADLVRKLYDRSFPVQVGPADAWVPLVFSDDFARLTLAALQDRAGGTSDTAHWIMDEATPPLSELVQQVSGLLGVPAPSRRVSASLVRALPRALTGVEPETLAFLDSRRYPTESMRILRTQFSIEAPPFQPSFRRWLEHLVATDFLRTEGRGRFIGGTFVGELGVGPKSLIMLHGLPLEHRTWAPLVQALGQAAYAPDLPGLGRSGPGLADGAWLADLFDELELPHATVVAHSFGIGPALELAAAQPQRIESLVLISPYFLQRRPGPALRCVLAATFALERASESRIEQDLCGGDSEAARSIHASLQRPTIPRATARRLAQAARKSQRAHLRTMLSGLEVPVHIIHGAGDPLEVGSGTSIANAGHNPHLEAPGAVAQSIRAFVGQPERCAV